MKVLVTGANGVIGRAMLSLLESKAGVSVCAIGSRKDLDLENFIETRAVLQFVRPDAVIHLAGAVFGLGGNLAFPADSFRRNTLINCHVIEASRLAGVRKIIAMGTAAIYSDELPLPYKETDCLRGAPHASEFGYAFAKRGMLVQLESYKSQYGLDFVYAIATNMYGPYDRFDARYGHVVPSLISKFVAAAETGDEVRVWGDGSPSRDFLYSKDAAQGLWLMLNHGSGSYNLATGVTKDIRSLVQAIAKHFPGVTYSWNVDKPLGQLRRHYDISKLSSLGFRPEYDLDAGIGETINWFKKNNQEKRMYDLA